MISRYSGAGLNRLFRNGFIGFRRIISKKGALLK